MSPFASRNDGFQGYAFKQPRTPLVAFWAAEREGQRLFKAYANQARLESLAMDLLASEEPEALDRALELIPAIACPEVCQGIVDAVFSEARHA